MTGYFIKLLYKQLELLINGRRRIVLLYTHKTVKSVSKLQCLTVKGLWNLFGLILTEKTNLIRIILKQGNVNISNNAYMVLNRPYPILQMRANTPLAT